MIPKPDGSRRWTARIVALLLAVEAVLLAFSTGATAGAPARDAFGHVLCTAAASGERHGAPVGGHAAGLDCCTLACGMAAGLPPPAAGIAVASPSRTEAAARFALRAFVRAGLPPSPRQARAPPLSA